MKKRGAKKRGLDIRIFLDTESVFIEGNRADEDVEHTIQCLLEKQIYRAKLENGYIENNKENRQNLKRLQEEP